MQQLPTDLIKNVERDLYSRSFKHFVKAAWHVLEPDTPLLWGWHIEAICDHLQAVSEGHIRRLIISISPGSMKSLLSAVFFPAWEWTFKPTCRYVVATHSLSFASRDSMRCRDLIMSSWYQELWPTEFKEDANQTLKYINKATGYRWALPYSKLTGGRGNRLIIDDPISVMDALTSDTNREKVNQTFLASATSRLNNPKTDAIIIIAQRIHQDDLIGRLIDLKLGYTHLNITMEFVAPEPPTPIGWVDPRKVPGELMLPQQRDRAEINELKMGDIYAYSAQYQQNPVPVDDGFFKREWFKRFDPFATQDNPRTGVVALPKHLNYFMTSDHAPSGKKDYNTIRVWGVDEFKNFYLVDTYHERSLIREAMGISSDKDGRVTVADTGALALIKKYKEKGMGIQCWFAEPDNNFKSVEAMVRDAMMHTKTQCRIEYASLHNKNKREKAIAYQTLASSGKVFLPIGQEGDDTLLEYIAFPNGKHDDRIDSDSILPREFDRAHAAIIPKAAKEPSKDHYKMPARHNYDRQKHLY